MLAQQESSLLLLMVSFSGLLYPGSVLPALPPFPSPSQLPPLLVPSGRTLVGVGGGWHQGSVLSPWLPLASRFVDTALAGSPKFHLPLRLAMVSVGGMQAGYINRLFLEKFSSRYRETIISCISQLIFYVANHELRVWVH